MRDEDKQRMIACDVSEAVKKYLGPTIAPRLIVEAVIPVIKHHMDNGIIDNASIENNQVVLLTADIKHFHEKYGLEYNDGPRSLNRELHNFRQAFMQEELDEYETAHEADDLEGQLDALVDLAYVLLGTAYLQGLPFAEAWRRVHTANMAKVRVERAEDSKRGSTFDVVKPDGWTAPDHSDLVKPIDPDAVDWETV